MQVTSDIKKALELAYLKIDKVIIERAYRRSGATAVTALITTNEQGERWLYVANIGDARAVLK